MTRLRPSLHQRVSAQILVGFVAFAGLLVPLRPVCAQDVLPVTAQEQAIPVRVAEKTPSAPKFFTRALRTTFDGVPTKQVMRVLEEAAGVYLPLSELVRQTGLPITVDRLSGKAVGTLLNTEKKFKLDVSLLEVTLNGRTQTVRMNETKTVNDEIYLSEKAVEEWLQIKTNVDRKGLYLHLVRRDGIPLVQSMETSMVMIEPAKPVQIETTKKETAPEQPAVPAPTKPQVPKTDVRVVSSTSDSPLDARDWEKLKVFRDGAQIGEIEAFTSLHGTYLRLDAFVKLAGFAQGQQVQADIFGFVNDKNQSVQVNLQERTYQIGGQKSSLLDRDAFLNDAKIYVGTDLLHRLLPDMEFYVDLTKKKLVLPQTPKVQEPAPPKPVGDVAPTPKAAPVGPVIVDGPGVDTSLEALQAKNSPADVNASGEDVLRGPMPDTQPPLKNTTQSTQQETKALPEEKKEAEVLVLQIQIKKLPPSEMFIEAQDFGAYVLLPIGELFQIFDFNVKLDANAQVAHGHTFTATDTFSIDLKNRKAQVGEQSFEITPLEARQINGATYINKDVLEKWFGLKAELIREMGLLTVQADRLFAAEEKEERQKRWDQLLKGSKKEKLEDVPLIQNDYTAIDYPVFDVTLNTTYESAEGSLLKNQYNVQGAMEMGYLTSDFYAQGSTDTQTLDSFRLKMGREDPDGHLLGAMKATEFAVGDVESPSVSFVTGNSLGRGGMVTNREPTTAENFDVRSFTGNATPGQEVELYRNNVLIAFQTVDANGRYNFTDVPILYGENTFRMVFYGEQGVKEERVETVSASSALLKEGQFEYTFGAVERGVGLIPLDDLTLARADKPIGPQYVAGFRYGLLQDYTIGAAVVQTQLEDGAHRYVTTSSGASIGGVLSETTFASDLQTKGWASGISLLTGIEDVSLRARYRAYRNFMSETVNTDDEKLKSETNLDANTQVYLPLIHDIGFGLSAYREEFEDQDLVDRYTYGLRLSKSFWGIGLTNTTDYIRQEEASIRDTFGFQTRLGGINFRSTGVFQVEPDPHFDSATFSMDYRLTEKISGQTQVTRDMDTTVTTAHQNINWDFDDFRLSFSNAVTSEGEYRAGLNLFFSLYHDKISDKWKTQSRASSSGGAVAGRVFHDDNNNGVFDEGEALEPKAKVKINRAAVELDENGYFVTPVTAHRETKVELDVSKIDDPMLSPTKPSVRVITRPGDTVVADFALARTTVVDGNVYIDDPSSPQQRGMANLIIELRDEKNNPLRRVLSDSEGYYTFDKVPLGSYWIVVPDDVLTAFHLSLQKPLAVKVDKTDEFFTGNNLLIQEKSDLTAPPKFDRPKVEPPASPDTVTEKKAEAQSDAAQKGPPATPDEAHILP